MDEKLKSNAEYMRAYRAKLSEEKKQKMLDCQKASMKKKREKEKAEKLAQGIVVKIGRPKSQSDMTTKELKEMIQKMKITIQNLESQLVM